MFYKSSGCTTQVAAKELGSALTAHLREKGKHQQVNMFCSEKTHISCLMLLNFDSIPGLLGNGIVGNRLLQIAILLLSDRNFLMGGVCNTLPIIFIFTQALRITVRISVTPKLLLRMGRIPKDCSGGKKSNMVSLNRESLSIFNVFAKFQGRALNTVLSLSQQNLTRPYILNRLNKYVNIYIFIYIYIKL